MSNDIPDSNPFPQRRMSARLNCPHCHNPIELVADSVDEDVLCPSCGSAVHVDSAPMLTWDKKKLPALGQFQLIEAVGRGAFGTVYKAFDQQLQRTVAVKIPRSGVLETDEDEDRFVREARNVAQLRHPGIVAIHSVGRSDAFPYLVSEFVEGVTLSEYLTAKRFSIKESARLIREICIALQHAHSQGVVHRDLKPSNIMLTPDGQPRIMDFGVAKRNAGEITMTIDGQILGTPAYMSPEQAGGLSHQADAQSDIYSVGVILFQLLTGELPFRGDVQMLLYQVQYEEPPSPRKLNHQVPRDLETICLKCMAKEPKRRYASAGDLADDVQRYLDGIPILARPVTRIEHAWRWCRRNPVVAGLSTTAVISLALTAVVSTLAYKETSRLVSKETLAREKAEKLAESNARLAVAERESAERSSRLLDANAQLTEKERQQTKLAERNLYAAHMNLVQSSWDDGRIYQTVRLLDLYRPKAEQSGDHDDLRGFEWYYWDRMCHKELMTLKGHNGHVESVTYSPDGKLLASASYDGTVKLWNVEDGTEMATFKHPDSVSDVSFSSETTLLASDRRVVTLWDIRSGTKLRTYGDGNVGVRSMAVNPKNQEAFVSLHYDGMMSFWNVTTGTSPLSLKVHERAGVDVAFSPDGSRVASTGEDRVIDIRETETGKEITKLPGPVYGIAFSHDGKHIASQDHVSNRAIRVREVSTGREKVLITGLTSVPHRLAYSFDGQRLVSGHTDGSIHFWDPNTGAASGILKGHFKTVNSIAFHPSGKTLASASDDFTIKIWDSTSSNDALTLRDRGKDDMSKFVTFSPDGSRLASANGDGTIKIWDPGSGLLLATFAEHRGDVYCVAFNPKGTMIATAGQDTSIVLLDVREGKKLMTINGHDQPVKSVAFDSTGTRLASVCGNGKVKIWDVTSGKEVLYLEGIPEIDRNFKTGSYQNVLFSPDSKLLASGGLGGQRIRIWSVENGKSFDKFASINLSGKFAFSPDGLRIATTNSAFNVGSGQEIGLFDVSTGRMSLTLTGHTMGIYSLAFNADGTRLDSSSHDSSVKVWDTATGADLLTLKGDGMDILSVAISPDGRRIASGTWTGVKVWDATPRTIPKTFLNEKSTVSSSSQ